MGSQPWALVCRDEQVRKANEDGSSSTLVTGPPADVKTYPDMAAPLGLVCATFRPPTWCVGPKPGRHLTRGRHTPRLTTCCVWGEPWLWRKSPRSFSFRGLSMSLERPRGHPHSPYLLSCDRLAERPRTPPGELAWFQPCFGWWPHVRRTEGSGLGIVSRRALQAGSPSAARFNALGRPRPRGRGGGA